MILEALWGLVTGIVSGLFSLVPAWNVDTSELTTFATTAGGLASLGNGYFPVTLLVICLGIVLALKVALTLWDLIVFVYTLIPFKMT